ncbi:beta-lactamase/transpeptidase-like protein [Lasiosphaeria ovina]|uniref:Beta-lactamase/transpeptidase-like protein n=1 Tax=Lasiosphaeria ovina TaxID=92902 RepID=A0AAE0TYG1_9PEZI|nr:beta-lactamase/transpeptidase-like protein [Lasiosphaeria ovina]
MTKQIQTIAGAIYCWLYSHILSILQPLRPGPKELTRETEKHVITNTKSPLLALRPTINGILRSSGAMGASVAIFDGKTEKTYFEGFGRRDKDYPSKPDEHTVYHLASLSKSFTAAAMGLLAAEGKLKFEDPISKVVPEFHYPDEKIRTESTILDFLSHRTGLASKNALWQQDGHELLLEKTDTMGMVSNLEVVHPLGEQWLYNNWGYDMLGQVIERVSGISWGEFINQRILKPLNLNETTTALSPPHKNYAHGYMPGPRGKQTDVGRPVIAAGTVQQAANGIKSTCSDLITYYRALWTAFKRETSNDTSAKSVLKHVTTLVSPHIQMNADNDSESYGAGWAIADLPSALGSIGTNGMFIPSMPLVGRGCEGHHDNNSEKKKKGPRIWYHNGSLVGFFSSVHVIQETGTIIVVLINSIPKNDAADWIGQLILEAMLNTPQRNDYLALAKTSAAAYDKMWKHLPAQIKRAKTSGGPSRSLAEYTGRYYNAPGNWFIEVKRTTAGNLEFLFQGRNSQRHRLEQWGPDTFAWPLTEAQSRQRHRWPDLDVATYVFHFGLDPEGARIGTLRWVHDPDVPEGETFVKAARPPRQAHSEL